MSHPDFYSIRGNKDLASRLKSARASAKKMNGKIHADTDVYTQNLIGACQEIVDQTPQMDWSRWINKPSRVSGIRSKKSRADLLAGFSKQRGTTDKAKLVLIELIEFTMSCVSAARGFDYTILGLPMRSAYGKV